MYSISVSYIPRTCLKYDRDKMNIEDNNIVTVRVLQW